MRVALVAMSGVRVCDAELMRLGLTMPGFVERSKTIASLPSLGLLTLAALTPEPHTAAYYEVDAIEGDTAGCLAEHDLVAISALTARAFDAYALADELRAMGTTVVMGGLHATAMPDEAGAHVDAVIVGEGEAVWGEVVRDAAGGRLRPRYRAERGFDLADAPMPRYELLDMARYNRITVQTCRGCPWRCEFCGASPLLTRGYAQKPIERVLAEVDRVCALWPRPFLELADDNSFVNRAYWRRLLPELKKRRVRWFTETDLSIADDEALLAELAEAGCVEVLIGLESPVPEGLAGVELRQDFKLRRLDGSEAAVRRVQSHGVRVNGCFVLGLDGHTPEVFDAVHDATERMNLFDVQITLQTPFPGTPLYERLLRSGRMHDERPWERCTLFDLTHRPSPMTEDELRAGFYDLAGRLYTEEFTRQRRAGFADGWRRGRAQRREAVA